MTDVILSVPDVEIKGFHETETEALFFDKFTALPAETAQAAPSPPDILLQYMERKGLPDQITKPLYMRFYARRIGKLYRLKEKMPGFGALKIEPAQCQYARTW